MSQVDISGVLSQMRALQAQAQGAGQAKPAQSEEASAPDFSKMLESTVAAVNNTQQQAGALSAAFERGEAGVDLPEVMVALQKARVSFQAMAEVRNRLVSAYQDIMNMPM